MTLNTDYPNPVLSHITTFLFDPSVGLPGSEEFNEFLRQQQLSSLFEEELVQEQKKLEEMMRLHHESEQSRRRSMANKKDKKGSDVAATNDPDILISDLRDKQKRASITCASFEKPKVPKEWQGDIPEYSKASAMHTNA